MNVYDLKRLGLWVCVVGLISAALVSWIHANRRAVSQAAIARMEAGRRALTLEHERVAGRVAAAEDAIARRTAELERLQPASPAPHKAEAPRSESRPPPRRPWISERLQNEPEFQLLWLADRRASLATRYGPLFKKAGLTPEQIRSVEAQMIARAEREMDLEALGRSRQLAADDPVMRRMKDEIGRDDDAAMRQALGESGWAQLRDYERGALAREIVAGTVGGAAVVAREPLSPGQAEQLFESIVSTSRSYRNGGRLILDEVDWDAVDAAAQRFLTPRQFEFFRSTEPPPPLGGRFQSRLYQSVGAANAADKRVIPVRD